MNAINYIKRVGGWAKRTPAAFLMHLSLVVIVLGALCTHFWGEQGKITLQNGCAVSIAMTDTGDSPIALPFSITLNECITEYYPASTAPSGYRCNITIVDGSGVSSRTYISMTHMLKVGAYRFTLASMGADSATFTINHDPVGIPVTYTGYALLLVSIIAYFFTKHTAFRVVLHMLESSRTTAVVLAALLAQVAVAADTLAVTNAVPDNVARTFGKIYVYWDERPTPVQTMTKALLSQVYGKDTYRGLSSDQVALGWILDYDNWKHEPIIKVKSRKIRDRIGVTGRYAALTDFFDANGYKLQPLLDSISNDTELSRVDRSVQLLSSLSTGSLMRIFPYMSANGRMEWLSWTDYKPSQMPLEQWSVVSNSMSKVARSIILGKPQKARKHLLEIRDYQLNTASAAGMPLSQVKFRAEIIYNKMASPGRPAMAVMAVAFLSFLCVVCKKHVTVARRTVLVASIVTAAWLLALIILRRIIAGHLPMTNGPESMELMALIALAAGVALNRRYAEVSAMAMMVAGLALLVAYMSGNANVISPLMPVLNSPLLSIHVLVIMCAYALLAIILIISVTVLCHKAMRNAPLQQCQLSQLSLAMLYPAVFLLAIGIFIGAVWANQSWGRYWGWDPKETWALITMLVYSVPLHWRKLRRAREAGRLAVYLSLAFLCVLITYFGVNFFLGGLHSYAS